LTEEYLTIGYPLSEAARMLAERGIEFDTVEIGPPGARQGIGEPRVVQERRNPHRWTLVVAYRHYPRGADK
jgi:hypothetical protein